jgi:hypothetical protein
VPLSQSLKLFESSIIDLTGRLESEGVSYPLLGGIAASLHSAPRATQDVDCVIWIEQPR